MIVSVFFIEILMAENLAVNQDLSSPIVQTIGGEPWQNPMSPEDSGVIRELRAKFEELNIPIVLVEDPLHVRMSGKLSIRVHLRGLVERAKKREHEAKIARETQEHEAKVAREAQEHEAKIAREARERQFQHEQNDVDHQVQLQLEREKQRISGTSLETQHLKQQSISGQIVSKTSGKLVSPFDSIVDEEGNADDLDANGDAEGEGEVQGSMDAHVTRSSCSKRVCLRKSYSSSIYKY